VLLEGTVSSLVNKKLNYTFFTSTSNKAPVLIDSGNSAIHIVNDISLLQDPQEVNCEVNMAERDSGETTGRLQLTHKGFLYLHLPWNPVDPQGGDERDPADLVLKIDAYLADTHNNIIGPHLVTAEWKRIYPEQLRPIVLQLTDIPQDGGHHHFRLSIFHQGYPFGYDWKTGQLRDPHAPVVRAILTDPHEVSREYRVLDLRDSSGPQPVADGRAVHQLFLTSAAVDDEDASEGEKDFVDSHVTAVRKQSFTFGGEQRKKLLSLLEIHRLTGHRSLETCKMIGEFSQDVELAPISKAMEQAVRTCEICVKAKSRRPSFKGKREYDADVVFVDVFFGKTPGADGVVGAALFVHASTRYMYVKLLKTKDSVNIRDGFQDFVKLLEAYHDDGNDPTSPRIQIKYLVSDQAKEQTRSAVEEYCDTHGIIIIAPRSAADHTNTGLVERSISSVKASAAAFLLEADYPPFAWPWAVEHATIMSNMLPHRGVKGDTPYASLTGAKPSFRHVPQYGRAAALFIDPSQRPRKADQAGIKYTTATLGFFAGLMQKGPFRTARFLTSNLRFTQETAEYKLLPGTYLQYAQSQKDVQAELEIFNQQRLRGDRADLFGPEESVETAPGYPGYGGGQDVSQNGRDQSDIHEDDEDTSGKVQEDVDDHSLVKEKTRWVHDLERKINDQSQSKDMTEDSPGVPTLEEMWAEMAKEKFEVMKSSELRFRSAGAHPKEFTDDEELWAEARRRTRRPAVRRFETARQATASAEVLKGSINRLEVRTRIQERVRNLFGNVSNLLVPLEGEVDDKEYFTCHPILEDHVRLCVDIAVGRLQALTEANRKANKQGGAIKSGSKPKLPTKFDEIIKHPKGEAILQAMALELATMFEVALQQFDRKSVPKNAEILPSFWVMTEKPDKGIVRARMVLNGKMEKTKLADVFSPTANNRAFKTLLAVSAQLGWHVSQVDVKQAFLQAEPARDDVYMTLPPGYARVLQAIGTKLEVPVHDLVCKLTRSVYGLVSSPRQFHRHLSAKMDAIGMIPSLWDPCTWRFYTQTAVLVATVHVDDFLVCSNDLSLLDHFVQQLSLSFELKDQFRELEDGSHVSRLLGMDLIRDSSKGEIRLSQEHYIDKMVADFQMEGQNSPLPGIVQERNDKSPQLGDQARQRYLSLVGSLLYLARQTRPDILYAVMMLCRKMAVPSEDDWDAALRTLAYANGTKSQEMVYCRSALFDQQQSQDQISPLAIFTDANFVGKQDKDKSTGGHAAYVYGCCVSAEAKSLSLATISVTESELIAASVALSTGIWLTHFLGELRVPKFGQSFPLLIDNKSTVINGGRFSVSNASKHVAARMAFLNQYRELGVVLPCHVKSEDNFADVFTKGNHTKEQMDRFRSQLLCTSHEDFHRVVAGGVASSKQGAG